MNKYDVTVIGGGPAGLAASIEANKNGSKVLLIEREGALGGILKQCIHDGFGLLRFKEKLSGPEYVYRDIKEVNNSDIEVRLLTFVTRMIKVDNGFEITVVSREGLDTFFTKAIVLATGCRERTAKQVKIHGTRPSGVITAGAAQSLVNIHGLLVTKKCVILGSGDIGLIMARRLTLEGSKVVGVYEIMPKSQGLQRNVSQCLNDYNIPLYLSHTVTRVIGHDRVEAVEISKVDEKLKPIIGTEEIVECDSLILSVGLIPENELAESLEIEINPKTKGPVTDNGFMTSVPGVFSAGNCLHVYDLVDYVSENGRIAGESASFYAMNGVAKTYDEPMNYVSSKSMEGDGDLTCIVCPNGCSLKIVGDTVTGNKCKRGIDFAKKEMTAPERTFSLSVKTIFNDYPVLPVRVSKEIPKEKIFDVVNEINKIEVKERLKIGDIVIKNVLNLNVDVIAIANM